MAPKRVLPTFLLATFGIFATTLTASAEPNVDVQKPEAIAEGKLSISASEDGHFLAEADGKPFFFLGENAEYLLWKLTREETDLYLSDRAKKGFTVIMAHLVPRSDMNIPNAYGHMVFVGGDIARPNPKYFEHVDWVISRAAHYGLRIGLAPINGIEYVAQGRFNDSNAEAYGRWLGARYRDRGVIWILGHDATPIWAEGSWEPSKLVLKDFRAVYDRMAKGIIAASTRRPFITFHPPCCSFLGTAEPRTSLYWGNRSWLDMNMIQSSHFEDPSQFLQHAGLAFGWVATRGYEPIREEYDSLPTRPIIDGEAHWEGVPRNPDDEKVTVRWDEVDIRNAAYQSVFSGAAGHSYGNVNVYAFVDPRSQDKSSSFIRFSTSSWKDALDAPGARQIGHLRSLMLSRPYFTRIPDQTIISSAIGEGSAHISATRDRTGGYAMLYLPLGQSVTVDMTKMSSLHAKAWWFDPRTGDARSIDGVFPTSHAQQFTPPSAGRGNDWVLLLDDASKSFPLTGSRIPFD